MKLIVVNIMDMFLAMSLCEIDIGNPRYTYV